MGLIDRVASLRETVAATKKRIGAKSIRLVAYQRASDYRPNYYAHAPALPHGDINLFNVDMASALTPPAPQFLYLWTPGQ